MNVLVTGGAGLLGAALARSVPSAHRCEVTVHTTVADPIEGVKRHKIDLRQPMALWTLVERRRPDLIIHTAYSRSDHAATVDLATEAAIVASTFELPLVHISTDALFDGTESPYDESAVPSPITPYGHAKARCEELVRENCPDAAIVRTSLIVNDEGTDGTSSWFVEALRAGERATLFRDEYRTPIGVEDLAAQVWELASLPAAERAGVWHLPGAERLSRVELGERIAARLGLDASLIDVATTDSFDGPRPADVTLTSHRAPSLTVQPRPISSVGTHGSSI